MTTLPAISEDALHKQVADYLALALPEDACFTSTLNEGKRGWKYQKKLKDFRVMPGWPDITIIHRGRAYFIELKAPGRIVNGKVAGRGYLTTRQHDCVQRLLDCGARIDMARSIEEVNQILKHWRILKG